MIIIMGERVLRKVKQNHLKIYWIGPDKPIKIEIWKFPVVFFRVYSKFNFIKRIL